MALVVMVKPSQTEVGRVRGRQNRQVSMLAFVDVESRIALEHPLRTIKYIADEALAELSPLFDQLSVDDGRPSIPPERLLKASLLMSLYSIRSERAFCEQVDYHLLYRWFLGMDLVEPVFDRSTFSKNRERLLQHPVAQQFFDAVVRQADRRGLLSNEHFTVDGTLIQAAASLKSFKARAEPSSDEPPDDPGKPDRQLPRSTPLECDPSEHDGSRGAAGQARRRQRGAAGVCGPGTDGASQRPAGGLPAHAGHRYG